MTALNPKTQRWLDLIAFLVGRRFPVTQDQLMEGVYQYRQDLSSGTDPESVRRKFERDKDDLRRLGIPLETVDYVVDGVSAQGYQLRARDFYLPYLELLRDSGAGQTPGKTASGAVEIRPDELGPAVAGLGALAGLGTFPLRFEARSALCKLTFDLADVLDDAPPPLLTAADPDDARARVETLTDAVSRRKEVGFQYRGMQRETAELRRVYPYGLLFKFNRWYLVGWDLDRKALRTYRVSRMDQPSVNDRKPASPDFEVPDDLDLTEWSQRQAWDLPGDESPRHRVTVRFHFPRSLWAERNAHGEAAEPPAEDGSQLREFDVRQADPFLRWLLTLEGDAEIMEPPELRARFRELAARVAALYDTGGGTHD